METNVSNVCLYFVSILLRMLSLSGVTYSLDAQVIFTSSDPTDQRLPNNINVTLTTSTRTPTEFRMIRVDYESLPIYSIETFQGGDEIKKENVPSNGNIAFYQDTNKEAVFQLSRSNGDELQSDKFIITRGQYREGHATYSIQPTSRTKREASQNHSLSDQRYILKQVLDPPITKCDSLVAPPDLHSSMPTNMASPMTLSSKFKRRRRHTFSTYYIDVAVFIDSIIYSRFLKESSYNETEALTKIREYYAFIFTGVDLIYQSIQSTQFQLRVRLTKIVIFQKPAGFQWWYADRCDFVSITELVIGSFSAFLNSTKGKDLVFPYDHAMLFVGVDLMSYLKNILGMAYIGTLCRTDGTSSSIIESMGHYSELFTAAHELGHILGGQHDGDQNKCSEDDLYVMAPAKSDTTFSTRLNPWRFSNCTVEYFTSFLAKLANTSAGQTCLSNTLDVVPDIPDVSHRLLGQEISLEKQCQLRYGPWSYVCQNVDVSDICSKFYCYDPNIYAQQACRSQPALSGTSCGCGKICQQGACTTASLAPECGLVDNWPNCTMDYCLDDVMRPNCSRTCADFVTTTLAPSTPETTSVYVCRNEENFALAGMTCDTLSPIFCVFSYIQSACCKFCENYTLPFSDDWCYDNEAFTYANFTCQTIHISFCNYWFVNISCCKTCNYETNVSDVCQDDPTFLYCGFNCQTVTPSQCTKSSINQSCCETCRHLTTTLPSTTATTEYTCHDDPTFKLLFRTCQTMTPMDCKRSHVSYYCCGTCSKYTTTVLLITTTSAADIGCYDNKTFVYAGMNCTVITPHFCNHGFVQESCCKTCANYTNSSLAANLCYDNEAFVLTNLTCQTLQSSDCHYWFANLSCCKTCSEKNKTFSDYGCYDDHNFTYNGWTCETMPPKYCNHSFVNESCCDTCNYMTTTLPVTTSTAHICNDDHGFTYNGFTCQTIPLDYCGISYFYESCCEACSSNTSSPRTTTSQGYSSATCQDDPNFSISGMSCYFAMLSSTNYCYNPEVNTSCCASCALRYTHISGCEYGDRDKHLCANISSCHGHKAECCQTCGSKEVSGAQTTVRNMVTLFLVYMALFKYVLS